MLNKINCKKKAIRVAQRQQEAATAATTFFFHI